jgi:hypothetical protein
MSNIVDPVKLIKEVDDLFDSDSELGQRIKDIKKARRVISKFIKLKEKSDSEEEKLMVQRLIQKIEESI